MFYIALFAFAIAMWLSVTVRTIVLHPVSAGCYAALDLYNYIVRKGYNNCKTGEIIAYIGLFGRGKTLSAVHHVVKAYHRFNDVPVWDRERKKFVTQKIKILSNVELNIPYEKLVSLSQIVSCAEHNHEVDLVEGTLTITLVLGDEFSVQMNSRNFKSNIDPLFLNTLLTCRHHHISLVYTAQRFQHVDALLRQVTSYVVECKKIWRVMVSEKYDAWDMENANSVKMVKPLMRFGWFIRNRDFEAYDTLACVDNLSRSCKEGDMLSEAEILALQCNQPSDMDAVSNVSRTYKRRKKKGL